MQIRPATPQDAAAMGAVLRAIIAVTGRDRATDIGHVLETYIDHPDRIACTVAELDGALLGFQSLRLARAGNPWGVSPGLGIIGTHISPAAHRKGAGRALFMASLSFARAASLPGIDASIGADNTLGLAYYDAMGFRDDRQLPGTICKLYDLG